MMEDGKTTGLSQIISEPGSILEVHFWPERIKVVSSRRIGTSIEIYDVGVNTGQSYPRVLTENDLVKIKSIRLRRRDFSGGAEAFFPFI